MAALRRQGLPGRTPTPRQANTNFSTYHLGIGTGVYWFMGGPGVDPHYNGTTAEAYAWGQQQAIRTLSDVAKLTVTYPVIFMDVEIPGNAPGYQPGPGQRLELGLHLTVQRQGQATGIPAERRPGRFNGFFDEIEHNSTYTPGVYSSAPVWAEHLRHRRVSHIPHTYEWTYLSDTSSLCPPARRLVPAAAPPPARSSSAG